MQAGIGGFDRGGGQAGGGGGGRRGVEGKGDELIEDLLTGVEGRNAGDGGEGQGHPAAGAALAVAEFNAVVAVAEGDGQIPLGGMAVDHHLLKGMGVGGAAGQSGDIGDPQAELGGAGGRGRRPGRRG